MAETFLEDEIAAEVSRLEESRYGDHWVTRRNGRVLLIHELAELNVSRGDASVREMANARKAPGSQTDRELFAGVGTLADQFKGDEAGLKRVVAKAKRLGYNPGDCDFYNPTMVRPEVGEGDPEAFIPATGGRGHIKKVAQQRGLPVRGQMNLAGSDIRPPKKKPVRLAEDIVREKACEMVRKNPDLRMKTKNELRQMVMEKHAPKRSE